MEGLRSLNVFQDTLAYQVFALGSQQIVLTVFLKLYRGTTLRLQFLRSLLNSAPPHRDSWAGAYIASSPFPKAR